MEPLLSITNLTAGYGTPIVHEASFSLYPGEIVGLLGRNGSGKTTLLRGLTGAARVYTGQVLLCGQDGRLMTPRQRETALPAVAADRGAARSAGPGSYRHGTLCPQRTVWQSGPIRKNWSNKSPAVLALTLCWIPTAPHSVKGSASWSIWPGSWSRTRRSSCWTSPTVRWTLKTPTGFFSRSTR